MDKQEKERWEYRIATFYKENLIYINKEIKIFKCSYKNIIYYMKYNSKDLIFSFSENFNKIIPFKKDIKKEPLLLKEIGEIIFYFLEKKEDYYKDIKKIEECYYNIAFSISTKGRPRKYFANSLGKISISTKKEKLKGKYKKVLNTSL